MPVQGEHSGGWVILVSFGFAGLLSVIPLADSLRWLRPEWVALFLIYWVIALPQRVGLLVAMALGIFLDVLEGAVLGQHVLSLAVIAYLALILHQRLRVFKGWQQSGVVFLLVGVHLVLCHWVQNLASVATATPWFLIPALSSAIIWPLVFQLLRFIRRHYRVN